MRAFVTAATTVVCLLPGLAAGQAPAPTASLSGHVQDESGAPIPRAVITVTAAAGGAVSRTAAGAEGRFEIRSLAPGRYSVVGEQPGLLPAVIPDVVLTAGGSRALVLELKVPGISELVAVGAPAVPRAAPSLVAPLAMKSVAGAGENIYRVLQVLPGVAAASDFDSRLSVRGGGPDQNLTMMDGVEIYNPYRVVGLTSAFNPETVANVELITGGFNAQYGDRLSSILIVDNRPGTTPTRIGASGSASMTDANLVAEGGLPGGSSWLVAGRRTYYDAVAGRVIESRLPTFGDLQARVDIPIKPGQRLSVSGVSSRESAGVHIDHRDRESGEFIDALVSTHNDLGALTYSAAFGARAFTRTTVSWYRHRELSDFAGDVRTGTRRSNRPEEDAAAVSEFTSARHVSIRDAAVRQQFGLYAGTSHLLEAGFETHTVESTWRWRTSGEFDASNGSRAFVGSSLSAGINSARSTTRAAAWLTDRWTLSPRIRLEPGVRVDWSGVSGETIASPRLAAMFDVSTRTRVRVAGGRFTQSPGYEKLLQSDYFVDLTSSGGLGLRSERAWHALSAVERRLDSGVTMRVEGYYKDFDRLVLGRLETPAEVAARVVTYDFPEALRFGIPTAPHVTTTPGNIGTGRAYGVEFYAEKRATSAGTRLSGWASYTLGRAETTAYGRTFPADYDRRHALTAVSSFRAHQLIEIGGTLRAQSGFPQTTAVAVRPAAVREPAAAAAGLTRLVPLVDDRGLLVWSPDFGDASNFNAARLPFFVRLDARVTYRPRWSNNRWQFYLEVVNLLNRENASTLSVELAHDPMSDRPRITEARGDQLPLLPTFGVRFRF